MNSELWDNSSLTCVIGIPEGEERQVENEIFKETMVEIFIYLTKYLLSICCVPGAGTMMVRSTNALPELRSARKI